MRTKLRQRESHVSHEGKPCRGTELRQEDSRDEEEFLANVREAEVVTRDLLREAGQTRKEGEEGDENGTPVPALRVAESVSHSGSQEPEAAGVPASTSSARWGCSCRAAKRRCCPWKRASSRQRGSRRSARASSRSLCVEVRT